MIPLVRPIKYIHVSGFNGSRSLWSTGIIHASEKRFLQERVRMPSWNPYCFSQEAQKWCRIGEAAGTAQVFSSWGVALPPGCGHCPAHSRFGREQCYAAQAASASFASDTKQERMPIPERVTIIALAEEGGDAARHGKCTFPSATEASVVHHSTNRWMLWQ